MKGTELGIWVDEFNFSSSTSRIDLTFEVQEAERTHLDGLAQEFLPILPKCTVAQNGYFEGVLPDGFEAELAARFGAGQAVVTVLTQKSDANCVCYVLPDAQNYSMVFGAPAANLVTLNGQWGTSVAAFRGLRIFDDTFDAVESGASVDFGVGSTNGAKVAFHVASVVGTGTGIEIAVQSSADGVTWDDENILIIFAPGGMQFDLENVVGRYRRLTCKTLGGATSIRCMAVVSYSK